MANSLTSNMQLTAVHPGGLDIPLRTLAQYPTGPSTSEKDLRDYLSILLGHKWLILTVVLVVTSAVALYVYSLPPIYEASATLELQPREYTFLEDNKGTILHSYDSEDYTNTQIKLLSNPQLMRHVVLKLGLDHNPAVLEPESTDVFSRIRGIFSHTKPLPAPPANEAAVVDGENNAADLSPARIAQLEPYASRLLANLKVEPQDRTNLVTVSITHPHPEIAAQVVDTLTKIFIANSTDYETKGSQSAAETLGRQIADLQSKIKQQENERLNYLKSHNLPLEKGDGRNLTAERLAQLSSQLLTAENDRKNFESIYESAKTASEPGSIPAVRESAEIQDMRRSMHQLEQKRASLTQIYTPEWPEVKKVDSEIKQLQESIAKSSKETVNSLKSKLDAAADREAKLRQAYYQEREAANGQTQDEIALASLNQEIETSRQLHNILFTREKEREVNSLDKSKQILITNPAVMPTQPIGPTRWSRVLIAVLVSLVGAMGLAVLVDALDTTLRSAEDVATHTDLPTLALIPTDTGNGAFLLGRRGLLRSKTTEFTALSMTKDVRSPAAEAYRHLRASLLFSGTGEAPQSILVTSGGPYEGKTTTAINTAVTFAQTGAEVLIVDCDLRRPQIHRHFKFSNSDGLTSFLAGEREIDSLFHQHEDYPNLKLITAGPMPANPAGFLGSDEMRTLMKLLERRFTHIIIDSPPASSFADASLLSTLVDGVIIVVHSKRSSRRAVRRVKERLQGLGASVCGVVLNHVDLESKDYYSEYYTSHDY